MKSRNILILALMMAVITTVLFSKYLKELDTKYKKNENKISIVVPKVKINRYQKITKELLEFIELETESVHPESIRTMEEIEGKYALTDMKKGEALFSERFIDQYKEEKFVTRKIREGYRAVSIEVNIVESVTNLIEPEDNVDVIFSEEIEQHGLEKTVNTEILLEDIRVLAVGKRLKEKEDKDIKEKDDNNDEVEYISVTLELKPQDIVKLINADERGNIKLTLRSKIFPK
ncbi:Flp pilus assembly protein CpaB [Oceanirhabdus sp. W0125-5]|uniref:Flp pilus assembly protein CpaB n=1 Tax=Oceanirhabdus sp. W0125-5 TaxID=2999116 RepID=UPI0022F2F0AD|nr:Flp pilus assembly protein CpaB [Oceanirhabdus sp. W0125-5]WBW95543.1 Flp pilus assembly protein CpaB [Oceanirhabdus sp. W0125-5]